MKSSSATPAFFLQVLLISFSMCFILYISAWNLFSGKAQHSSPAPTHVQTGQAYHEPQTGAHTRITTWLPKDYELDDTAKKCERIFGSSYITSTAARRTSHCPVSSPSRLDCFHAARELTPHEWPLDTLCLARGVQLSHSAEGAANNTFSIQCPLDDDFGAGQQVDSIQTPKPYFFGTGVTQQLANWASSRSAKKCSSASIKAEWIVLVRRGLTTALWDIFMEVMQAMISVDILRTALDESGEPYMSDEDLSQAQIVFEDNETLPFEELWHLVLRNHKPPVMKKDLEPGCYHNIVLPLPGSSSPIYTALLNGEFHRACRDSFLVRALRRRVLSYYGFADGSGPLQSPEDFPSLNITIIGRKKTRMIWDLESMVDAVRTQHPAHTVNIVDFEELTLREQVQLVSETDILVGVHGSSLTHAHLPP